MNDWDDLRFILALSRGQTMKQAADILNTNSATVSRRISRITKQSGVQLFRKEKVGWIPTAEAAPLIELATRIELDIGSFESNVSRPDKELRGKISISCYQGIATVVLVPQLDQFHSRYPKLALEIDYRPHRSLARSEIDLSLRLEQPKEGRFVSKRVGTRVSGFFTRDAKKAGSDWIGLSREFDDLPIMKGAFGYFGKPPVIRLGTLNEVEEAVLSSDFSGPLLTCNANRHSNLEQLEIAQLTSATPVYMIYHESRRADIQLQAAKGWVENCFAGPTKCLCGHCKIDAARSDR